MSQPTSPPVPGAPSPFSCRTRPQGPGLVVVEVAGELDLATAPELRDALWSAASRKPLVVLDLRQLTFMDSTGLHVIAAAHKRLPSAGCRLQLIPGPPAIRRLFALTGMDKRLEFVAPPEQIFELDGRVSSAAVLRVEQAATAALADGTSRLCVSFGPEARLPTSAIATMIAATRRLRDQGATVRISGEAARLVHRVIVIAGLDRLTAEQATVDQP